VEWGEDPQKADSLKVTLTAHLSATMLEVRRCFKIVNSSAVIRVEETIKSLVGFERALGRAEHVTIGNAFLKDGAVFHTNADKGHTLDEESGPHGAYARNESFDYPQVPSKGSDVAKDWRHYPHAGMDKSEGLLTLRIEPSCKWGWFTAQNTKRRLVYVWDRAAFPWLVTWEENGARTDKPWNGRTLTRGLEFSSYAFPSSRRENVRLGSLHDTPTFEWLDAFEERTTEFFILYQEVEEGSTAAPLSEGELSGILG